MQLKIRIMADILMYFLTALLLTISKSLLKRSIKWFDRFPFSSSISPLVRPALLLICPLRSLTVSGGVLQRYKNIDCFSVTETHLSAQVSDNEIGYRLGRQAQTKGVAVYVRDCLSVSRRGDLVGDSLLDTILSTHPHNISLKKVI